MRVSAGFLVIGLSGTPGSRIFPPRFDLAGHGDTGRLDLP